MIYLADTVVVRDVQISQAVITLVGILGAFAVGALLARRAEKRSRVGRLTALHAELEANRERCLLIRPADLFENDRAEFLDWSRRVDAIIPRVEALTRTNNFLGIPGTRWWI